MERLSQRKPCELEITLDRILGDLKLDLANAKTVNPTGVSYIFFWDERPCNISVPPKIPNDYSHVFRMEIEVGEFPEADAGYILYEIAFYLNVHDCTLIRVVPKPSSGRTTKILLQTVGLVDWFKPEVIAECLIHMADLSRYFHNEMVQKSQSKAA